LAFKALLLSVCIAGCLVLTACDKDDDSPRSIDVWPPDYPISGDSLAVIYVSIDSVSIGAMVVECYPDSAPNHVRNFKWLANRQFYDGVGFHRVVSGFVIQGGDPTGTGTGGVPWTVHEEFNGIHHVRGIVSMARTSDPNSASSQFFVVHGTAFPHLDGQYTVFGNLFSGYDVLDNIANVPVTGPQHSTPTVPVIMDSVRIIPHS